ncbi:MAG: MBL fold metallo-hydrolase [Clostridia bacterium]
MKITKFPQSCLWIETKGKKILVDPGNLKYEEAYFETWKQADVILITHRHKDHCYKEVLEKLSGNIPMMSTKEVQEAYPSLKITIVKETDEIALTEDIQLSVVHAEHGFLPPMKKNGGKIEENVGYIIDDGENRLYVTSDTICFENEYTCDIIALPVSDYGVVMGPFEAGLFAKEAQAKLAIPLHADNISYPVDFEFVKKIWEEQEVEYEILENGETIEIE